MLLEPARNPSEWPAAQRDFRRRYAEDPTTVPRLPVRFSWFTRRALVPLARLSRQEQFVAVFEPDPEPGLAPLVVFAVEPGTFTTRSGSASGEIVGELAPNGALGLEVTDDEGEVWVIWPIYNPLASMRGAPTS